MLSTREHSRSELARKLLARNYPIELVNPVLDELEQSELLNEVRMIETYVAERLERGFGPKRIRAELQAKGLSDAQIDPYLSITDEQLSAQIQLVHDRRFGAGSKNNRQTLAKRARFLEYRGFPSSLIQRFLDMDS
ncbi:MAG TPA: RecX family transcriptional regulator [Chromatiaceae bacterium]|nr:MAG: regulatory protein RecX [Thiohalocapsa sp. PB-PSB1]HBG96993.1 RecX family transcriptional regulator [Chromatiaceae bacterium]HCS89999.1 RecX family transcriptional regulator [Chromatiaceae bacterium]